jgi:hypothetical protein
MAAGSRPVTPLAVAGGPAAGHGFRGRGIVMQPKLLVALGALVSLAAARPSEAQRARFDDPPSVCGALLRQGVDVGQWRRSGEDFDQTGFYAYACLSDPVVIQGSGNPPFVTSLNYFAEGRTIDRVEIVKLVLNVHDRKTRDAGRTKFVEASKALFGALAIDPPPALTAALEQSHAGEFPFSGGRIRFEVWSVPVERQRLTIETGTVLRR